MPTGRRLSVPAELFCFVTFVTFVWSVLRSDCERNSERVEAGRGPDGFDQSRLLIGRLVRRRLQLASVHKYLRPCDLCKELAFDTPTRKGKAALHTTRSRSACYAASSWKAEWRSVNIFGKMRRYLKGSSRFPPYARYNQHSDQHARDRSTTAH